MEKNTKEDIYVNEASITAESNNEKMDMTESGEVKGAKKGRKKKLMIGIFSIIIVLVGVSILVVRQQRLNTVQKEMEQQLSKFESLKHETYFTKQHEKIVSELKVNSKKAIDEKSLKEMTSLRDKAGDLYKDIEKEIQKYNKYFELLTEELKASDGLITDYFAKTYDVSKLKKTRKTAKTVVSKSNYKQYEEVYKELSGQDKKLESHLKKCKEKIYNAQTDKKAGAKYPFKVELEELPRQWSFQPIIMQTISHPTHVVTIPAQVLYEPDIVDLFIDGGSANYYFDIKQIKTKEITVQSEDGTLKKALVNTEVDFMLAGNFAYDRNVALNERPAYLFKDQDGIIYLALKNYDGEDHYVLYSGR